MSEKITLKEVWCGFEALMDDASAKEEDFHRYMVRYPSLIPVWRPFDNVVYSKLKLGSQHVTDFAYCRDDSPGFKWHFIEIEKPKDRLFTKDGNPSHRLSQALRQCLEWNAWFKENRDYVARYFPHAERVERFGLAEPRITLIMGRREWINLLNKPILRELSSVIEIRSFDSLQGNLRTAYIDEEDKPLRCCSYSPQGLVELSRMQWDIRFRVG